MIITRTPLRVSFVGGGSDRPSFYSEEPGACVAATIDKYVYVAVNEKYDGSIRAAYSLTENVPSVDLLQHELIREALKWSQREGGIEVHSIADLPGGSGLGSSSSFTVGLLAALDPYGEHLWAANIASQIEIEACHKPIGKQDQYTAAYGGLNLLTFTAHDVDIKPLICDMGALSAHCLLLDTGLFRNGDAGVVLSQQQHDRDDVRELVNLALIFSVDVEAGNFHRCGAAMDAAWQVKKKFVGTGISHDWNIALNAMYTVARLNGAWGGKLCGAGGGGFLLFLAPPDRHQAIIQALGLRHVPIKVGVPGCQVVYS